MMASASENTESNGSFRASRVRRVSGSDASAEPPGQATVSVAFPWLDLTQNQGRKTSSSRNAGA